MEEAKMRAKFPMVGNKPLSGHSAFLQKRLAKGVSKPTLHLCFVLHFI